VSRSVSVSNAILVVSSSPVSRAGVAALLREAGREEVLQAASLEETDVRPKLVVAVPVTEPEVDALLELEVPMVVLGPVIGVERLAGVLVGRPWAYLSQQASADTLAAALRAVEQGLTVHDPSLGLTATPEDDDLTPREREVLNLIGLGLANKTIAYRLGISEHTAKFHVASVLAKLGAATRAEAVRIGASRGLLPL